MSLSLERLITQVGGLDWDRVEDVNRIGTQALDAIVARGQLEELISSAVDSTDLVSISERQWWGDRLILYDDPTGFRIRLHRFTVHTDWPHSHRWSFTTRILSGGYHNMIYGREEEFESTDSRSRSRLLPSLTRFEGPGSSYTLDHRLVHNVTTTPNTVTVIIRGPAAKNRGLRVEPGSGELTWKYGSAFESDEQRAQVAVTRDDMLEACEDLYRIGLLDRTMS